MRETVLNFSSKFLDMLFDGVKPASDEFIDKYSELKRMSKGKTIKMNGIKYDYSSWISYVFTRYNDSITRIPSNQYLPDTSSADRQYIFWNFDNKTTEFYRKKNKLMFINTDDYLNKWDIIGKDSTFYFVKEPKYENEGNSWNNKDLTLRLTTNVMIFQDLYALSSPYKIRNNLFKIFEYSNYEKLFLMIVTVKEFVDKLTLIELINHCQNNKIQYAIVTISNKQLVPDRYLLTDYFAVNANHSFESVTDKSGEKIKKESELNFKPLIKNEHRNFYYKKIETIINTIEIIDKVNNNDFDNAIKNDELLSNVFSSIDELIEKLRSL